MERLGPREGLNIRRFWTPVSITKRTPGTVTEVSAMFVARITFLVPWGVIEKALYC